MAVEYIWPARPTPGTPDAADTASYELGVKFQSTIGGNITQIWWWEAATSVTTTWKVNLWSAGGSNLGNKTTASGVTKGAWNVVTLDTPIAILANTTYVASVNVTSVLNDSHYPADATGLASSVSNGNHLATVADGANGVFNTTEGAFPATSFNNTNYWRDVAFDSTVANPTTYVPIDMTS